MGIQMPVAAAAMLLWCGGGSISLHLSLICKLGTTAAPPSNRRRQQQQRKHLLSAYSGQALC